MSSSGDDGSLETASRERVAQDLVDGFMDRRRVLGSISSESESSAAC